MAQPITRSAIGATAETAESGIGGGLLGGLAGILGGGLLGAAVVAVAGGAVLGAIGLAGGALIGALDFGFAGLTMAGAAQAGAAALAQIGAVAGALVGGVGGAYYGGIAGGVIGAVKGTTDKMSGINADERLAHGVEKSKQIEKMQQVAAIREQAIDEGVRLGYERGAGDAQAHIMNQLQQAAVAQQQTGTDENKPGFVDKLAKERGVEADQLAAASSAERAHASKEAADQAAVRS